MSLCGLPFRAERQVSCAQEVVLPAGRYVLVLFTHQPGEEGHFEATIWSDHLPADVLYLRSVAHAVFLADSLTAPAAASRVQPTRIIPQTEVDVELWDEVAMVDYRVDYLG